MVKRLFGDKPSGAAAPDASLRITVTRQACCAADDQMGPLEAVYNLAQDATLAELLERIQASRFLQFSSTHNRLSGEVDGVCVVKVFAGWGRRPQFHADPKAPVGAVIGPRTLDFCFRHV